MKSVDPLGMARRLRLDSQAMAPRLVARNGPRTTKSIPLIAKYIIHCLKKCIDSILIFRLKSIYRTMINQ